MYVERYRGRHPVYFRPLLGLRSLQDEMNRVFSDYYGEPDDKELAGLVPAMDVTETADSVNVKVELPGVKKEDVQISLKDELLTIRGEKKEEKEEKEENRHFVERSYGTFSRTLTLPSQVKTEGVKATFKDGILHITLPKEEEARTREVKVKVD